MKYLILFCLVTIVILSASALPKRDFAPLITNRYLGNLEDEEETTILKAFVKANPNLTEDLRDTRVRTRKLSASPIYSDGRAIINVLITSMDYSGSEEVYFNGGRPKNPNVVNNINLSLTRHVFLRNLPKDATDAQIVGAFLAANSDLPSDLLRRNLKVQRQPSGRTASLYVTTLPNIEGHAMVSW